MMADKTAPATDNPAEDAAAEDSDGIEAPAADAAQAEVADLKNKLLRTLAEMENLRRRTEREMSDARQYAVANFAREMLTVSDNLKRAIDAVPAELRDGSDPALSALIEGVEVTEKGLQQALTKHGVKRIEPLGEPFNHEYHQAMYEVEDSGQPGGTIVQLLQPGYVMHDRLLRPAMVAVAKGRPEAPPPHERVDTTA